MEEPTFDSFYATQQLQKSPNSHGGSNSSSYNPYPPAAGFDTGAQNMTDEPAPLRRSNSNASVHSSASYRARAESSASMSDRFRKGPGSDSRQDSFPFGETSTLIATAPKNGIKQGPPPPLMPGSSGMYGGEVLYSGTSHGFSGAQQPGSGGYWGNEQSWMGNSQNHYGEPMAGGSNVGEGQYGYGQSGQYAQGGAGMPGGQNGWENEYLNPNGGGTGGAGGGGGSNHGQGNWDNTQGGGSLELTREEQDVLERIISRASSRSGSPMPQSESQSQILQGSAHLHASDNNQRPGSQAGSRAGSPFPTANIISPPGGSSSVTGSPFNKPQSPPALIIPNTSTNSTSPALPPIVTQTPGTSTRTGTGLAGAGSMGGLLPPTNPALEHLSGIMGISPIAPNADGPQIFVQPSTPISGLRDGRGLFDAALRRAGQMAQANQNQQGNQGGSQNGGGGGSENGQQYNGTGAASTAAQQQAEYDALLAQHHQQQQNFSQWTNFSPYNNLSPGNNGPRPRAKSDSYSPGSGINPSELERQAFLQYMAQVDPMGQMGLPGVSGAGDDWKPDINAWRNNLMPIGAGGGDGSDASQYAQTSGNTTMDPRQLPGNTNDGSGDLLRAFQQQHQLSQLQAQKARMAPLNVNVNTSVGNNASSGGGVFKYEPGEFSPTSLAFYQQLGISAPDASQLAGTTSAPFHSTNFQNIPQHQQQQQQQQQMWPQTAAPGQSNFLVPGASGTGERRRSFAEGSSHPTAGAGTPGYGVGIAGHLASGMGHRRAARSEDFGRNGEGLASGWGVGAGGSTSDFLNSITANDGTLLPPSRGRSGSHSRHSSVSSVRSASPALSISSQGSSYGDGGSNRMEMPDGTSLGNMYGGGLMNAGSGAGGGGGGGVGPTRKTGRVAKMKVTSMATEVASTSRRTNEGVFKCPVPGCGSTFTRHFNLKGHLRSHNDERPYKCLYDGCPKSIVGFARQHDCKRHMALHVGLRPFECEGCGKKFARLDALTRHHKSEQGQECAVTHPLPTNPDGSAMSESQYKAYRMAKDKLLPGGGVIRRPSFGSIFDHSGDERSGGEEDYGGAGSGMEDYDRA